MQEQSDNLTQILLSAISPDAKIRVPAEEEIKKLTNNNFGAFLFELSKKQANEKESNNVRQLCATLIKNIINSSTDTWLNLDQNLKEQIKNNILSSLITEDIHIKNATGLCIAGICRVELPRNQWNNIFDILINASQNNNINVKITTVIILGMIYEDIKINNINNNTISKLTNMYYSLLTSKSNKEGNEVNLIINCLISLKKFVRFLEGIISKDDSRLVFFNMVKEYMLNSDENIRRYSIDIFAELINYYYKYFQNYIDILMQVVFQIIENDSETNKKYCFELLFNIGEKEANIINQPYNTIANFHFLNKYKEKISEILLNFIITNDYEEEEYTLSKCCTMLIVTMCQCCDYQFTEIMLNYYKNNISSNNPIIKFAALKVFLAILETKEKLKIFSIVQDSLIMLSSILLEKQTILSVRKLIAEIMKSISKNFGFLIIKNQDLFDKFMTLYIDLLKDSPPEIMFHIIIAINELIKRVETNEYLPTNILSQYSQNFYQILLSLSQNINLFNPNCNIPMSALYTIGTYGQHVANDVKTISFNVFKSLVEMFASTLNKEIFNNDDMRLKYQEYICTSLNSFLMNKKALEKDVRNLFNYVIQSFQQRKEIYEEGISLIGAISSFLQRGFMSEMNTFNRYLLHGLNYTNSYDICKSSLICLSEIILSTGADFNVNAGEYLKVVINILSDSQINRELKPKSLHIISDLFISCKQEVFKSFDDIMKIIGGAFEACLMDYTNEKDNIDFFYYIMELKEGVLETMGCIFNAVQDVGKTEFFIPYAKSTVEFINRILRDIAGLNVDIIKNAIALIADFCNIYGKNIKPILNINLLKDTIENFKNNKEYMENIQNKEFILWAQRSITEVILSN